jgi:hypothetical protein
MVNSTPEYLAAHIGERLDSIPTNYARVILAQRRAARREAIARHVAVAANAIARPFRRMRPASRAQPAPEGVSNVRTPGTEEA